MNHRQIIRAARESDAVELGVVVVSATRSAFEGLVPEQCLAFPVEESARNWQRFLRSESATREWLLVATDPDDTAIALILAGRRTEEVVRDPAIAAAYPHEISSLQIAPDWQRQGLGRTLIRAVANRWRERGHSAVAVRVLEPNPNRRFYERLGASVVGQQDYDWEGFATRELIYAWPDITDV